jgi:glyoxylase-like metal-dependent hydrolase (beta-lactamase superfamily II)
MVEATPSEIGHEFISCYILTSGSSGCIVETGPAASYEYIDRALKEAALAETVKLVIPTHIHLDHGGGVGHILNRYPDMIGLAHPKAYKHLINPDKLWDAALMYLGWLAEIYRKPEPVSEEQLRTTYDGMEIVFGDIELVVIHTPGHASHHQSIYFRNEDALFVGDSAGALIQPLEMIVPTTLPPIRLELYLESINKMINYKPSRLYYTHYGFIDNATDVLKEYHRFVIDLWNIAKEYEPKSIEEYKSLIVKSIDDMDKLFDWIRGKPIYNSLMDFSLNGIMAYK